MTLNEKLLKRLPKKYHERFKTIEEEDGLVDDCKYILYWNAPWTDCDEEGFESCYPVRSITEAIQYIKDLYKREK